MFGGGINPLDQYQLTEVATATWTDTTGRIPKSLVVADPARTAIVMALGQSLGANSVTTDGVTASLYVPVFSDVDQVNPNDGLCYGLVDPVLGAGAYAGNVFVELGDRFRASGRYDRYILLNGAIGATTAAQYGYGDLSHRTDVMFKRARRIVDTAGRTVPITHAVWLNGQSEALSGTPATKYKSDVRSVFARSRALGYFGPWFVPQSTLYANTVYPTISTAQLELVDPADNIRHGGNLDVVAGPTNLSDGTHWTPAGRTLGSIILSNALLAN